MADEAAPAVPLNVELEQRDEIAMESNPECGGMKRNREEDEPEENAEKRTKVDDDKCVEEGTKDLENEGGMIEGQEAEEEEKEEEEAGGANVGMKKFGSSVEMFDYFYKLLHTWPANLNLNEYEHIMLLELLKKGHLESEKKIGCGIKTFQVRFHPQFKSRCFFLVRDDESVDDFSFRKCVDRILPLPESMHIKHDANKLLQGKGGGSNHGRGRGRGHGQRGRGRK